MWIDMPKKPSGSQAISAYAPDMREKAVGHPVES